MRSIKFILLSGVFSIIILLGACSGIGKTYQVIAPLKTDYPHWNFDNRIAYNKLVKINTFIENNKDNNNIAIFDWDGTLYNENIPVKEMNDEKYAGQPAWYFWMASNRKLFSFPVFPMFDTKDDKFLQNVNDFNKYLEGRSDVKTDGYNKFISTALFTAGMTPENVSDGTMEFLKFYNPEKYAFLPMLDILQKMINSGFNVWIVTGSSPYFVATQIKYIENNIEYKNGVKYNFKLSSLPYNSETDHIAGNGLKLLKNGTFSVVYDDKYVKNKGNIHYIVDGEGKLIVTKNLEQKFNSSAVFVAGNSGGDFYDTRYVVEKPNTLAIAVEPRGDLVNLVKDYPEKIIELNSDEI